MRKKCNNYPLSNLLFFSAKFIFHQKKSKISYLIYLPEFQDEPGAKAAMYKVAVSPLTGRKHTRLKQANARMFV
jgi:hypothetical protein